MENSLTGMMMAAGTIVTCIIISLAFLLAREGKGLVMEASGQLQEMKTTISEQGVSQYDRVYIMGNQVIGAVKQYEEKYEITVITEQKEMVFPMTNMENIYDENSNYYIPPKGTFWSTINRTESGVIMGITFEQKE